MSDTILITGASSGLGLAFLQHYASQPTTSRIIAIDISPPPPEIHKLPNIQFHQVDIANEFAIQSIASRYHNNPITMLLHCAGIRGLNKDVIAQQTLDGAQGDVAAAETYPVMNHETMMRTFEINTFGTFNIISSFLPSLTLAPNAKVVVLSSRMGSVSSNTTGGGYAYRASKAALNAVVKSFSIDVPGVTFLLLHPGRVETGLVGWKEEGAISVGESLGDCLKVIDGMEKEGSGGLVDRFGAQIKW
jgi:NAD(P)-dependent dehydrogenase (short-subunit alcohol dehydrogenase family)